jgi:excisionase family DNA binding protein
MAKPTNTERRTLSVTEAAALLGISRNKTYEAAKRGDIPAIKIGGHILVLADALDRLLSGERRLPEKTC